MVGYIRAFASFARFLLYHQKCWKILLHTRTPVANYLTRKRSAKFEVRADRPEERPWQLQFDSQVLPVSSEQAKDSIPHVDRVSSKDPGLLGQPLQTITSMRVAEEVPFDDPWNSLSISQIREPPVDVNNSNNTISHMPLALEEVSQEDNEIEDVSCLLEQKSLNDQLTLNAFEDEKGESFRNPPF